MGSVRLAGGTEIAYRAGALLLGDRFEIAVALAWDSASRRTEQEIIHEMADSPPWVVARGDLIEVGWTVFPIGADAETTVVTCWSLRADRAAFLQQGCDP
jgi:hypothetical protein